MSGEGARTEPSSVSTPPPAPRDRLRLPHSRKGRGVVVALFLGGVTAFLVYALTNPFLIYNALFHREILQSNLGNSTAMYGIGDIGAALSSALRIAIAGMTLGGVILAILSLVILAIAPFSFSRDARVAVATAQRGRPAHNAVAVLLAAPALCVLIQFILLAAGKPAEYARFGLVVFAAACAVSAVGICRSFEFKIRNESVPIIPSLFMTPILGAFLISLAPHFETDRDWRPLHFRLLARGESPTIYGKQSWTIGLSHEPAPWSVMPLNLFRDQLILTKPAADSESAIYDVYLYPSNLNSQIGLGGHTESVDWAKNRTQMILGSLPTTRAATRPR